MRYASWRLDFTNPGYGTGPEEALVLSGGTCEAAIAIGEVVDGIIFGYFEATSLPDLSLWKFTEIEADAMLSAAKSINNTAYFAEDGKISFEYKQEGATNA